MGCVFRDINLHHPFNPHPPSGGGMASSNRRFAGSDASLLGSRRGGRGLKNEIAEAAEEAAGVFTGDVVSDLHTAATLLTESGSYIFKVWMWTMHMSFAPATIALQLHRLLSPLLGARTHPPPAHTPSPSPHIRCNC